MTEQSHSSASIQLALLDDGRGKQNGLKLLRRVVGVDRRQKKVKLRSTGAEVAKRFLLGEAASTSPERFAKLAKTVLPALRLVLSVAPDITLGTFCVLLYALEHNPPFSSGDRPSVQITRELFISNLPRHMANLSAGSAVREGLGLIETISDTKDGRRIVVPSLTIEGVTLMSNVAAILRQKKPSPVKRPKPERMTDNVTLDDIDKFDDDDFDFTDIVWMLDDPDDDAESS